MCRYNRDEVLERKSGRQESESEEPKLVPMLALTSISVEARSFSLQVASSRSSAMGGQGFHEVFRTLLDHKALYFRLVSEEELTMKREAPVLPNRFPELFPHEDTRTACVCHRQCLCVELQRTGELASWVFSGPRSHRIVGT